MKIALQNIKVSEVVEDYKDKGEEGVRGYPFPRNWIALFMRRQDVPEELELPGKRPDQHLPGRVTFPWMRHVHENMGVPVAEPFFPLKNDQHVKAGLIREFVITIKQVALGQTGIDFPQALQDHVVIGTSPDADSNEKLPVETLDKIDELALVVARCFCGILLSVR